MKSTKNKKKAPKAPTVAKLIKKLDSVFSTYIRRKYKKGWYAQCFTCGVTKNWKELQNGHYISRSVKSLRFDERNCHPQCVGCNIFKHGAMDEYALALQRKYGDDILKELNQLKNQSKRFTSAELNEMIKRYGIQNK
jgi:hypothetical protein